MSFDEGDKVEYAAHPVYHQDDGGFAHAEEQDWRPATVLSVLNHGRPFRDAAHPHGPAARRDEDDIVVRLQPGGGGPPFDLNAKLVRRRKRR